MLIQYTREQSLSSAYSIQTVPVFNLGQLSYRQMQRTQSK